LERRFKQASRLLGASERTAALMRVIEDNRKLLRLVRKRLPPPLDAHCLHAALEDGTLTLVTDSSVWGSRLRFFAPELSGSLSPAVGPIESTRIRVQPESGPHGEPVRAGSGLRMSQETARLLREAAAAYGDSDLGRALRRLADVGAARGRDAD
jgi:hypothetical protein